jgi:hypothetical protein
MGKDIQNRDTGIWKVKHKIMKIKRKDTQNAQSASMATV